MDVAIGRETKNADDSLVIINQLHKSLAEKERKQETQFHQIYLPEKKINYLL